MYSDVRAMLQLPDERVLVTDYHRVRLLDVNLQEVSTVAGGGEGGHWCAAESRRAVVLRAQCKPEKAAHSSIRA